MAAIHQFVPMLHRHDAVGEHTVALRDLLRHEGVHSKIYSELPDPQTSDQTSPYLAYEGEAEPGDVLVYQFATQSAMAGWLLQRGEPLVLNYHSVTPPEFFAPWNLGITQIQTACLRQLAQIAPGATLGIAVSEFDRAELSAAGCPSTAVIPVLTAGRPLPPADPAFRDRLRDASGSTTWLSVGRLVPNKAHHLAIAALFAYRMTTDPSATLVVVGSPAEPHYAAALRHYAAQLGLDGAVSFLSGISDAELAACYDVADVLVMLSAHEGFGVPLVEAMRTRVPVVARDAGAVAEVLGDVGVLLSGTEPLQVAAAVRSVHGDPEARERALAGADGQLRRLSIESAGKTLVATLTAVAGAGVGEP
ncbi:MAG TPA: glycosyltransferase family 4 protein [Acidimicrobiales bacterium]